ncbi:hypothetical protein JL722_5420 [Aureococcus anophagefferens]|nr:hypothetical protein JL722_5420 [Aureococcus anophagefferens]
MDLDLAEIIDDGESGAPDYDVDDDYERQYLRVQHDFDKLTTNYRRLQTVNEALKRQIEQQHTQLAEYLKAKNDAERVKRVRVMEHQMKEVLEESDKERRQRAVAEEKTAELHKALNRERAQRLHDLHQNFRIAARRGRCGAKEMEDRYFAAEKEIAAQAHEKDVLVAACEAHAKINVATVREERAIERELEFGRAEALLLKSALQEARDDQRATKSANRRLQGDGSAISGESGTLKDGSFVVEHPLRSPPPPPQPKKKGKGSRIKPREVGVDVDEEDRVEFSRTGTIISKEGSYLSAADELGGGAAAFDDGDNPR